MHKRLVILLTLPLLLCQYSVVAQEQTWWEWLLGINRTETISDADLDDVELRIDLEKHWSFNIGDNPTWSMFSYDDSRWEKMQVPSTWENEGFHGYDGIAWYRVHFDGRSLNKDEVHFAVLGFIDDVDVTYLNGEIIGRSGRFPPKFKTAYNSSRKYRIPQDLINFDGDNVLIVRIYDHVLDGGIIRGPIGIYASRYSTIMEQELFGRWKFSRRDKEYHKQYDYDDHHWDDLLVPSFWDNQGYRTFDGVAWYRKTFNLSFEPSQYKNYYLVLGKIDDFDHTYLNGIEVGRTEDFKRFGQSESYKSLRVYQIPKGVLQPGQKNVIAVRVIDIGHNGGLYEGPIGVIEESNLDQLKSYR